jgi:hypothetical protein
MATITHGTTTVQIPDNLELPPQAGKLTAKEMQKIPKPPRGIGRLCVQAADAIERAGASFSPPPGVTPHVLREAGERADDIDQYLIDLDVIREKVRQGNLLFDAEAWKLARRMNDAIKAQMRHDPALVLIFQKVLEAFSVFASRTTETGEEPPPAQPEAPQAPAEPSEAPATP